MKPKLLIATDNFLPRWDGVARFLSATLPGLSEEFDITIIAPDNGPVQAQGYRLIQVPLKERRVGDFRPAKLKYWLIKREVKKHDLVFTQTIGSIGAAAIIAARKNRKPVVSYIHSLEDRLVPMAVGPSPLRKLLYPFMRWYTRFLYNRSNLLITASDWVNEQLSWNSIGTPKEVVPLGVDTKLFKQGSARRLRATLGIKDDDVVIGQHGRLAHEKDLKTLLRAFIRLRAKHANVKLMIVAEGVNRIKRELARQPGVILPGRQDDIVPYLHAMDIFALTSLTETTCLSALEAMSCGLPVVTTPVGFVRDYIQEGRNGMFVPFRDALRLSKKLEWLMEHPDIRQQMAREARSTVIKEFSWEKTIKELRSVLLEARKL